MFLITFKIVIFCSFLSCPCPNSGRSVYPLSSVYWAVFFLFSSCRYGAQGLTLSKIVPHICNLLGDPTSQVWPLMLFLHQLCLCCEMYILRLKDLKVGNFVLSGIIILYNITQNNDRWIKGNLDNHLGYSSSKISNNPLVTAFVDLLSYCCELNIWLLYC